MNRLWPVDGFGARRLSPRLARRARPGAIDAWCSSTTVIRIRRLISDQWIDAIGHLSPTQSRGIRCVLLDSYSPSHVLRSSMPYTSEVGNLDMVRSGSSRAPEERATPNEASLATSITSNAHCRPSASIAAGSSVTARVA